MRMRCARLFPRLTPGGGGKGLPYAQDVYQHLPLFSGSQAIFNNENSCPWRNVPFRLVLVLEHERCVLHTALHGNCLSVGFVPPPSPSWANPTSSNWQNGFVTARRGALWLRAGICVPGGGAHQSEGKTLPRERPLVDPGVGVSEGGPAGP